MVKALGVSCRVGLQATAVTVQLLLPSSAVTVTVSCHSHLQLLQLLICSCRSAVGLKAVVQGRSASHLVAATVQLLLPPSAVTAPVSCYSPYNCCHYTTVIAIYTYRFKSYRFIRYKVSLKAIGLYVAR